jgi:hypothetical protein
VEGLGGGVIGNDWQDSGAFDTEGPFSKDGGAAGRAFWAGANNSGGDGNSFLNNLISDANIYLSTSGSNVNVDINGYKIGQLYQGYQANGETGAISLAIMNGDDFIQGGSSVSGVWYWAGNRPTTVNGVSGSFSNNSGGITSIVNENVYSGNANQGADWGGHGSSGSWDIGKTIDATGTLVGAVAAAKALSRPGAVATTLTWGSRGLVGAKIAWDVHTNQPFYVKMQDGALGAMAEVPFVGTPMATFLYINSFIPISADPLSLQDVQRKIGTIG